MLGLLLGIQLPVILGAPVRPILRPRPECRNRLSQELIRDVEQINQQLNQLLFSGK